MPPYIKSFLSNCIIAFIFVTHCAFAGEVTLTIDDLPFVGQTHNNPGKIRRENNRFKKIMTTLEKYQVPSIGFVIARSIEKGQWQLLDEFQQAGNLIGNHTYSHINLNRTSAETFIENIIRANKILQPLINTQRYFRFPYLAEGNTPEKYHEVRDFLKKQGYINVPVTIDSKDFKFNQRLLNIPWRKRKRYLKGIRRQYLGFIWAQTKRAERKALKIEGRPVKQILLIHMNTLNAYFLGDIINMYRKNGYRFITLEETLKDSYYRKQAANHKKKIKTD